MSAYQIMWLSYGIGIILFLAMCLLFHIIHKKRKGKRLDLE